MDNFRKPNFELVADILFWMVKLYDPDTALSDRVEYESEVSCSYSLTHLLTYLLTYSLAR